MQDTCDLKQLKMLKKEALFTFRNECKCKPFLNLDFY